MLQMNNLRHPVFPLYKEGIVRRDVQIPKEVIFREERYGFTGDKYGAAGAGNDRDRLPV